MASVYQVASNSALKRALAAKQARMNAAQSMGSGQSGTPVSTSGFSGKGSSTVGSNVHGGKEENTGGVLGGVGYLAEKVGLNALSGVEGIVDYTVGGIAKLFDADVFATVRMLEDLGRVNTEEWFS